MDVVILTEAGDGRGYGHVARCYGLHEALVQAGRNVKLWVDCAEPVPDCVISGSAYQTFDWMDVLDSVLTADRASSVISVIDSYRVDRQLLDAIVSRSSSCFFFDDTGSRDYPNGTVINAAIHAESLYPRRPKGTRYLLGPSYAVLRKGFWSPRPYEVRSRVRRALVALGSGVDRKTARSVALSLEGCLAGAKVTVLHEAARSRPPGDGMERFDWAWDLPP
ncbi:MAG: hypothetical protein JW820_17100, partial [Spirochaetales bacterium]|nr:hypothetical protein [Spirochaetales bacterium]